PTMLNSVEIVMVAILIFSIVTGGAIKHYYRIRGKNLPTEKTTLESRAERVILFGCLTVFGLLYSLLSPFLLLFGYFGQVLGWSTISHEMLPPDIVFLLQVGGIVLYVIGYAIYVAGRLALKEHFAEAWRPAKTGSGFVSTGIYSRIRHPLYSGGFIYLTALILFFQTWFGLVLMIPAFVIMVRAASAEEKFLKEKFGKEYEMYVKRTGRFLPKLS
nr:isoprenylcysteine carboxylmethyltransferase family protein [Candidatus Njordarchaeota archaeon]